MIEVTKRIEFDAGHRVPDHASKCRSPHGHRYVVEIAVAGLPAVEPGDPENGMVVDFGRLKTMLVNHVHDPYDHAFLVHRDDPLRDLLTGFALGEEPFKVAVLPVVPTAENLCTLIADQLDLEVAAWSRESARLGTLRLTRVTVWETPTCSAEWRREVMFVQREGVSVLTSRS